MARPTLKLVSGALPSGNLEERVGGDAEGHGAELVAAAQEQPQEQSDAEQIPEAPESAPPSRVESGLDDAKLVAQVLAGDNLAFERLYRRYAGFVFNLAVRLQGSALDAEDLVHDAFLKAHQRLSSLRDPGHFKGWLGAILVSLLRTRMRRRRLLRGFGLGSSDPVELENVASNTASPEVKAELAQLYALLRLVPADERIAWTLRYVERHRLEEVANLSDCSLATAKRRIAKAQKFLDEHYVAASLSDELEVLP